MIRIRGVENRFTRPNIPLFRIRLRQVHLCLLQLLTGGDVYCHKCNTEASGSNHCKAGRKLDVRSQEFDDAVRVTCNQESCRVLM